MSNKKRINIKEMLKTTNGLKKRIREISSYKLDSTGIRIVGIAEIAIAVMQKCRSFFYLESRIIYYYCIYLLVSSKCSKSMFKTD
jgi:hypothetical protein